MLTFMSTTNKKCKMHVIFSIVVPKQLL